MNREVPTIENAGEASAAETKAETILADIEADLGDEEKALLQKLKGYRIRTIAPIIGAGIVTLMRTFGPEISVGGEYDYGTSYDKIVQGVPILLSILAAYSGGALVQLQSRLDAAKKRLKFLR